MWFLLSIVILAQQPLVPAVKRLPTPLSAVEATLVSAGAMPEAPHLQYYRGLWLLSDKKEDIAATILGVNHVSRSVRHVRPLIIPVGSHRVLLWNLEELAPKADQLENLVKLWDSLADRESYFLDRFNPIVVHEKVYKTVPRYIASDGNWYDYVSEVRTVTKSKFGVHAGGLGPQLILSKLLHAQVPLCRAEYWFVRFLFTVDTGFGDGLWYKAAGIEGLSFDQLAARLGADAKADNSKRRALTHKSRIFEQARVTEYFPVSKIRLGTAAPVMIRTIDIKENQTDDENDSFRNAIENKHAAEEAFFPLENGLQGTWLGDGNGKQVNEAPQDVVHDRYAGIGPGGTRRLNAGPVACGRCHVAESGSWYQPITNDLRKVLKEDRLALFDDLTNRNRGQRETVELFEGFYEWEPELNVLPDARGYYDTAVFALVGDLVPKDTTKVTWAALANLVNNYLYADVTPRIALAELGYDVPEVEAKAFLRDKFPNNFAGRADPNLARLRIGWGIKRWQFERIYSLMAAGEKK